MFARKMLTVFHLRPWRGMALTQHYSLVIYYLLVWTNRHLAMSQLKENCIQVLRKNLLKTSQNCSNSLLPQHHQEKKMHCLEGISEGNFVLNLENQCEYSVSKSNIYPILEATGALQKAPVTHPGHTQCKGTTPDSSPGLGWNWHLPPNIQWKTARLAI